MTAKREMTTTTMMMTVAARRSRSFNGVIERRGEQCEFHSNRIWRGVFSHTPFPSFHSGPTAVVVQVGGDHRLDRSVGRGRGRDRTFFQAVNMFIPAAFWTRQNSHLLKGESLFPLQVQQPLLLPFPSQTKQRGTISQQFNRRKIGLALTTAPWMESIHSKRDTAGSRQCYFILQMEDDIISWLQIFYSAEIWTVLR